MEDSRQMAAFGGIMGLDNRKQYGIGSKFKRAFNKVTKPFVKVSQKLMPKELAGISQMAAPFLGPVYGPLLMAAGQAKQKRKEDAKKMNEQIEKDNAKTEATQRGEDHSNTL